MQRTSTTTQLIREKRKQNAIKLIREEQKRRKRLKKQMKKQRDKYYSVLLRPKVPDIIGKQIVNFLPFNATINISNNIKKRMKHEQTVRYKVQNNTAVKVQQ
jgi:hypothetical protein